MSQTLPERLRNIEQYVYCQREGVFGNDPAPYAKKTLLEAADRIEALEKVREAMANGFNCPDRPMCPKCKREIRAALAACDGTKAGGA